MERLLYSSSPSLLKIQSKHSSFLPRLGRCDLPRLSFCSPNRPEWRRVNSISCKNENPSLPSSSQPSQLSNPAFLLSPGDDSPTGSAPNSNILNQIAERAVNQRKVWIFHCHPRNLIQVFTSIFFIFLFLGF